MSTEKSVDYQAKRRELEEKKVKLEQQIQSTTNETTLIILREDYRFIIDQLSSFYYDEPSK